MRRSLHALRLVGMTETEVFRVTTWQGRSFAYPLSLILIIKHYCLVRPQCLGRLGVVCQQNVRTLEGFRGIQVEGLVGEVTDHQQVLLFRIPGVGGFSGSSRVKLPSRNTG